MRGCTELYRLEVADTGRTGNIAKGVTSLESSVVAVFLEMASRRCYATAVGTGTASGGPSGDSTAAAGSMLLPQSNPASLPFSRYTYR